LIMWDIMFALASIGTTAAAFAYAAVTFFKEGVPMYYKLPAGAVGCFLLHQLSALIAALCGGNYPGKLGIGVIGIFGLFGFLLSANYGQIDGIVDDKSSKNHKARAFALAAPAVNLLLLVGSLLSLGEGISAATRVLFVAVLFPILPASYFCLKHLLLPIDHIGFLKSARAYNFAALLAGVVCILYVRLLLAENDVIRSLAGLAMSLAMVGLVCAGKKGIKVWLTLV